MAEYLSPGVYVEEFDSGPKAMEGVSTSTAGFIGLAKRGPVTGKPVLITGLSQFRSMFGGYLDAAVNIGIWHMELTILYKRGKLLLCHACRKCF